jgi:Holliday junction resolvase
MVSQYVRGRAFEYRVKRKLERDGYYVVRSSGSHTVADLVAVRKNLNIPFMADVFFVQCFRRRKSRKELDRLIEVCEKYNAIPCIATLKGRTLLFLQGRTLISQAFRKTVK